MHTNVYSVVRPFTLLSSHLQTVKLICNPFCLITKILLRDKSLNNEMSGHNILMQYHVYHITFVMSHYKCCLIIDVSVLVCVCVCVCGRAKEGTWKQTCSEILLRNKFSLIINF